nr:DUF4251 domain-containing protein [uncultured Mucilaginibacter sp.]
MKSLLNISCALLVCFFSIGPSAAQTTKAEKKAQKIADLKRIVDSKNYVFKANFAQPMSGSSIPTSSLSMGASGASIPLTSTYDLTLSNDTLTAYLPYYGVAYTAPLNPQEGGVKFTTTKFDYTVTEKKNGNIQILFKPLNLQPRAPSDVVRMQLTVSESGYANLQLTLLNRQPISFSGTLEEIKPKKTS